MDIVPFKQKRTDPPNDETWQDIVKRLRACITRIARPFSVQLKLDPVLPAVLGVSKDPASTREKRRHAALTESAPIRSKVIGALANLWESGSVDEAPVFQEAYNQIIAATERGQGGTFLITDDQTLMVFSEDGLRYHKAKPIPDSLGAIQAEKDLLGLTHFLYIPCVHKGTWYAFVVFGLRNLIDSTQTLLYSDVVSVCKHLHDEIGELQGISTARSQAISFGRELGRCGKILGLKTPAFAKRLRLSGSAFNNKKSAKSGRAFTAEEKVKLVRFLIETEGASNKPVTWDDYEHLGRIRREIVPSR